MSKKKTPAYQLPTFTSDTVKQTLDSIIKEISKTEVKNINYDTPLNGEYLSLDSLDKVLILEEANRRFYITIPDYFVMKSFQDLFEVCMTQLFKNGRLVVNNTRNATSPIDMEHAIAQKSATKADDIVAKGAKPTSMVTVPQALLDEYSATLKRAVMLEQQIKKYSK